ATSGLMMLAVNEAIRALKASATASPTATMTMSPRMRKFLNPVSMLPCPPWPSPPAPGGEMRGERAARPWMPTISLPAPAADRPFWARQRTARRAGRPAAHRPRAADPAQRAMITTRYRGGAKYYITKGFAIPALAEVAGQIAIFQAG